MPTQEARVVGVANEIMQLSSALYSIGQRIGIVSAAWTNLSVATKLNAFPTAAITTTGAIGAIDGTPVVTNPINTGIAPGNQLVMTMSATNVASLLTYLQGIQTAIGGGAVSVNGAATQLVALTIGA